jgi:hypothetical protein
MRTSYYSVTPDTIPGAVCISRYAPRSCTYLQYPALAPGKWFRSAEVPQYIPLYMEILNQLDPHQVWIDLYELTDGVEPILLCYESPSKFCHRFLAADWLTEATGIPVEEGRIDKRSGKWANRENHWELSPPATEQLSLL